MTFGPRGGAGRFSHDRGVVLVILLLSLAAVATVVGLLVLWPARHSFPLPAQMRPVGGSVRFVSGTVLAAGAGTAKVRMTDHGRGSTVSVTTAGAGGVRLHRGEQVWLVASHDPTSGRLTYDFFDFARGRALMLLAAVFAVVVAVVARWRGVTALVGLMVTYGVLAWFLLPALLDGQSPPLVGLTAAAAILFPIMYLSHGLSLRTSTALLGTLASLGLAAVASILIVGSGHLTGLSDDTVQTLQAVRSGLSLSGLLLCGFLLGTLGVLNDVTVTQASAVWELRDADPTAGRRRLYRSAMRIGRDHIASTVYTLVLAYAGSALPVLLLVTLSGLPTGQLLTGDQLGGEIARSLVGAIGLVAAVPFTTAIAVALVAGPPAAGTRGRYAQARAPAHVHR